MKAFIVLENGMVFEGENFGASGTSVGEVVFNTGMAGYEETLTDPRQSLWKPIVHLLTWQKNVEHSLSMTVNEKKTIRSSTA